MSAPCAWRRGCNLLQRCSLSTVRNHNATGISTRSVWQCRNSSSSSESPLKPNTIAIDNKQYQTDEWMNTPSTILSAINKKLHLKPDHPISITRKLIESRFPNYKYYNDFFPVVTKGQNFDSLGFPEDHPGRSRTDTYYLNKDTVLRTHTSAHQADVFRANESEGFLISADVYRRDAVDRSHYPIFHQMEGAHMWDREKLGGNVAEAVRASMDALPKNDIKVEDPNPTVHAERNPMQPEHTIEEVEAIANHLKRSLENVVVEIFTRAREAGNNNPANHLPPTSPNANTNTHSAAASGDPTALTAEPLRVRWIEAYFPFTSPSWELEIHWQGDWLEVLGCGVVQQSLPRNAGVPSHLGWAFGIGLERIAMLLFNIPDIRLFWSKDQRFLSQFDGAKAIKRFTPFSRHPECYKDVSFWLRSTSSSAGGGTRANAQDFHENDVMEVVRAVAGDLVEDVRLADAFTHPKTGRRSLCYRINYRSLERTLTNEEVNGLHAGICKGLVEGFGVEIR